MQQIQSGALPADTTIPVAQLFDEDGEMDDDEIPGSVAKKLRAAQVKARSSTVSSGGRTRWHYFKSMKSGSIFVSLLKLDLKLWKV